MPSRRRNRLCLRIIIVGALNFLTYTVSYAVLGGDAHNGEVRRVVTTDSVGPGPDAGPTHRTAYFVRGHFIRSPDGMEREVGRFLWIYSYAHSISVLVTSAAMIISMLVMARPHILATMRDDWIGGQTFITAFGVVVILISLIAVAVFTWDMTAQLSLA